LPLPSFKSVNAIADAFAVPGTTVAEPVEGAHQPRAYDFAAELGAYDIPDPLEAFFVKKNDIFQIMDNVVPFAASNTRALLIQDQLNSFAHQKDLLLNQM
jgi:hypothetical protein